VAGEGVSSADLVVDENGGRGLCVLTASSDHWLSPCRWPSAFRYWVSGMCPGQGRYGTVCPLGRGGRFSALTRGCGSIQRRVRLKMRRRIRIRRWTGWLSPVWNCACGRDRLRRRMLFRCESVGLRDRRPSQIRPMSPVQYGMGWTACLSCIRHRCLG
jgi:hypothetical protein